MPVQISCPKCGKQYNLAESFLGKNVRCKQCGTAFQALAPGQAATAMPVMASAAGNPNAEQLSNQQLNQFGIEGNIEKQADIFSPAPVSPAAALGNFAGEDPGFDAGNVYVPKPDEQSGNENPYAAVLNNPALRANKKKKGKNKEAKRLAQAEKIREEHIEQEYNLRTWAILWIFWGVLCCFGFVATIITGIMSFEKMGGLGFVPAGVFLPFAALFLAAGIGVRKLTSWGRIVGTLLLIPGLTAVPLGTLFSAMLLYAMWNEKGQMIFSEKYRKVVKLTPHIKYESILFYILIIVFIVLPLSGLVLGLFFAGLGSLFVA